MANQFIESLRLRGSDFGTLQVVTIVEPDNLSDERRVKFGINLPGNQQDITIFPKNKVDFTKLKPFTEVKLANVTASIDIIGNNLSRGGFFNSAPKIYADLILDGQQVPDESDLKYDGTLAYRGIDIAVAHDNVMDNRKFMTVTPRMTTGYDDMAGESTSEIKDYRVETVNDNGDIMYVTIPKIVFDENKDKFKRGLDISFSELSYQSVATGQATRNGAKPLQKFFSITANKFAMSKSTASNTTNQNNKTTEK